MFYNSSSPFFGIPGDLLDPNAHSQAGENGVRGYIILFPFGLSIFASAKTSLVGPQPELVLTTLTVNCPGGLGNLSYCYP